MATTKSAIVSTWGSPPVLTTVPLPTPKENEFQIRLIAAGQHQVVRSRAAGRHFSSGPLPHTPGVDGVGTILSAPASSSLKLGQKVYFVTFKSGGSFSEVVNVPQDSVMAISEGADPVQVAALVNPAMSSWMALQTRTRGLKPGFTVAILGVTSVSGSIAIEVARHLGARKVIGIARSAKKLEGLDLDVKIQLKEKVEQTDFSTLGDVDVILDYVYGEAVVWLLKSLKQRTEIQYVHVGGLSGLTTELPGALLRSLNLVMRGCGPGSWTFTQLEKELPGMLEAVVKLAKRDVRTMKLAEVEEKWNESGVGRVVYSP